MTRRDGPQYEPPLDETVTRGLGSAGHALLRSSLYDGGLCDAFVRLQDDDGKQAIGYFIVGQDIHTVSLVMTIARLISSRVAESPPAVVSFGQTEQPNDGSQT